MHRDRLGLSILVMLFYNAWDDALHVANVQNTGFVYLREACNFENEQCGGRMFEEFLIAGMAPVFAKFISDQLSKLLSQVAGKDEEGLEDLRKEVEVLKSKLEMKWEEKHADFEIRELHDLLTKIASLQKPYNLDLLSEDSFNRWALSYKISTLNEMRKPSNGFELEVWAEKVDGGINGSGVFKIGDKIRILFRPDRDCYLTLINLGTSGKLTVLFPNFYCVDNSVIADRTYAIPGADYPFEYELTGPRGIERIKAVATVSKRDLLDLELKEHEIFHTADHIAAARDISIVQKRVKKLQGKDWAEASFEFEVA